MTQFARTAPGQTEFRIMLDDDLIAIVDAVCKARGTDRTKVGDEIIRIWAKQIVHESNVILRLARGTVFEPE